MKECWKPVVGFEGLYEVSDFGNVRRLTLRNKQTSKTLREPRLLKPGRNSKGYLIVQLSRDNTIKTVSVHRLVLSSFRGDPESPMQAAHLNGNKRDNRIDNLMWATAVQNEGHKTSHGTASIGSKHGASILTEAKILSIRKMFEFGLSNRVIAEMFMVSTSNISLIRRRRTWRHVQ